jgi:sugar lactone lactonase YvrE
MPYAANQAVANTQLVTLLASHADGLETDSTGVIYQGAPEHNAIWGFRPETGEYFSVVRDPRIQWPVSIPFSHNVTLAYGLAKQDTLFVASDNRLYFTSNQYWKQPAYNNVSQEQCRSEVKPLIPIKLRVPI